MSDRNRRSERRERASSNPQWSALGRAIKLLRTEKGMDRGELAERSGLSYPYVSEIENGKKQPSTAALTAIAEALDMLPHELLQSTEWRVGPATDVQASMSMPLRRERRSWFRESDAMESVLADPADEDGGRSEALKADLIRKIATLDDAAVELLLEILRRWAR